MDDIAASKQKNAQIRRDEPRPKLFSFHVPDITDSELERLLASRSKVWKSMHIARVSWDRGILDGSVTILMESSKQNYLSSWEKSIYAGFSVSVEVGNMKEQTMLVSREFFLSDTQKVSLCAVCVIAFFF